jgi:hypothetical protein
MYGNGLVVAPYRGRMAAGHGGGVAGGLSQSTRFIDDAVAIVLLGNQDVLQPFPTSRRIADIVLDGVLEPWPDRAELAALAAGAGMYREVAGEDVFELVQAGDGMMFVSAGATAPVEHVGPGVFAPEAAVVHRTFGMPCARVRSLALPPSPHPPQRRSRRSRGRQAARVARAAAAGV